MDDFDHILNRVKLAAGQKILLLPHAIRQMARPDRMISTQEIRAVVESGEIVEDYPEDVRGRSCLVLGSASGGRPVHVVCAPKDEYLAIISAYLPDPLKWSEDFRERVK